MTFTFSTTHRDALPEVFFAGSFPLTPHAKLNLRLEVVGRRSDGFHLLRMVNVLTSLSDQLGVRFVPGNSAFCEVVWADSVSVSGPLPDSENLVCRAFHAFWKELFGIEPPCAMHANLHKYIPSGAGLGGGSSDAGAVLRLLQGLVARLGITIPSGRLLEAGARLGADVPFFCASSTALVEGIGERVTPIVREDLVGLRCLLVLPPTPVSTPLAYNLLRAQGDFCPDTPNGTSVRVESLPLRQLLRNDLQAVVSREFPMVACALEALESVFSVDFGMTGSGAAVFAIIPRDEAAPDHELVSKIRGKLSDEFFVSIHSLL